MKVIFAPTDPFNGEKPGDIDRGCVGATVTVEVPLDDMNLGEVFEHLIGPALKGLGYFGDTVDSCVREAVEVVEKKFASNHKK